MSRLSNLVTIWVIAWLCLLVMIADSVKPGRITSDCLERIPSHFWNLSVYDQTAEQLHLQLSDLPQLNKCLEKTKAGTVYTVQLVSVLETDKARDNCCDMQCQSAVRYDQVSLDRILANETSASTT